MKYSKTIESVIKNFKETVQKKGFVQTDRRFDRQVYSLPGHFLVIKDKDLIEYLQSRPLLEKYNSDWERMRPSFMEAVKEAKRDSSSRQLMVFNDADFSTVKQCFTSAQFIMTNRKEMDLYVYQRSGDVNKLEDDLIFFSWLLGTFEIMANILVTKIVVVYGNAHFTKE